MTQPSIAAQVAQLPHLTMAELWARWDQFFDVRPTHHNRHYVESRVAYKLQESAYGGLSKTTRRKLETIGETGVVPNRQRQAEHGIAPGTVLIREYNDREHRVTALPDGGFDYQGQRYASLSAIAKAITGTSWSGPVFFGLKTTQRKASKKAEVRP